MDVSCSPSFGRVSRLRLYGLAPGIYPLYVAGKVGSELALAGDIFGGREPAAERDLWYRAADRAWRFANRRFVQQHLGSEQRLRSGR